MPNGLIPYNIRLLTLEDKAELSFLLISFAPRERDRAFLKLPKLLDPLYFLIRPFRLIVDRKGR
jgi:hypothetical protein